MPLGDVIKTYREARRISQSDLAKRAQISQGTISRIEANIQKPNTKSLARIASVLNVSIDELLRASETEATPQLEPVQLDKFPSNFITRLQQLEADLTSRQQGIVVTIAQALALETKMQKEPSNRTFEEPSEP